MKKLWNFNSIGTRRLPGLVQVSLVESFSEVRESQPAMRHRRCFAHTSSDQLLAVILGLKFCGKGGLMSGATAAFEQESVDGSYRFIKGFKPLGRGLGSWLTGAFDVRQELFEWRQGMDGIEAWFRISFSPIDPADLEPHGSFLWGVEPCTFHRNNGCACWTELINTQETRHKNIPDLHIKRSARWAFQLGHNRLIARAAERAASILNGNNEGLVFAGYARERKLDFRLDAHIQSPQDKPE